MTSHFAGSSRPVTSVRRPARYNRIIGLVLITIVLPYTIAIHFADLKLTPGKLVVTVLIIPAMLNFFDGVSKGRRHIMASDLFAFALTMWMTIQPAAVDGLEQLPKAIFQAVEVAGPYIIGRSYFFEDISAQAITRTLKMILIVLAALAILDVIAHRYVLLEAMADLFDEPKMRLIGGDRPFSRTVFGVTFLRAAATFDHPLLYGTFCSAVAAILLYSVHTVRDRMIYVGLCIVGCLFSSSSAPLIALVFSIAIYFYNSILKGNSSRWLIIWSGFGVVILIFSLISDDPLTWPIRHLTFDPQTGYMRMLIWDLALPQIASHPLGIGFVRTGIFLVDASTDCTWLAKAITYGIPMISLLFLTAAPALVPIRGEAGIRKLDPRLDRMCISFSLVLVSLAFISLTVAFWNAVWLFSFLCIAMRVSLKEHCLILARKRIFRGRQRPQASWVTAKRAGAL